MIIKVLIYLVIFRLLFIYIEHSNLYHPAKNILFTPKQIGLGFEDISFSSPDGNVINGWFIGAKDAKVTILYCHGNGGNIGDRLHKIEFFNKMGMNFFIFDYRGYGKSKGFPTERGIYTDTIAAYDYLVSRGDIDKDNIVVYGKSLGGAIAVELCAKREAKALILESSLASVETRGKEMFPFFPIKLLTLQKYDALTKVGKITIPKLITHGRQDQVIGFHHGEALFKNSAQPKKFIPFDGGHNDDVYTTSDAFRDELKKFLSENSI